MTTTSFRTKLTSLRSMPCRAHLHWLGQSDRGAGFIEYALLLALIAAVVVGAATALGDNTASTMNATASSVVFAP